MSFFRKKHGYFDVPVQDLVLRITGPRDLYEEARAVGMTFWEQIQSYAVRDPLFRNSKLPYRVGEQAPPIIREMAAMAERAGVGPMFTFQGAITEYVGRAMARSLSEVTVSCEGDYFVQAGKRVRLPLGEGSGANAGRGLGIVVEPELGSHGIYSSSGRVYLPADAADGLVVVARSCILADAAATAATAILSKPGSLKAALSFLQGMPGVHGAVVLRGNRIGVAGRLELAA